MMIELAAANSETKKTQEGDYDALLQIAIATSSEAAAQKEDDQSLASYATQLATIDCCMIACRWRR
jgi:hypothetical protein